MGTDANWMDQKLPPLPHGEPREGPSAGVSREQARAEWATGELRIPAAERIAAVRRAFAAGEALTYGPTEPTEYDRGFLNGMRYEMAGRAVAAGAAPADEVEQLRRKVAAQAECIAAWERWDKLGGAAPASPAVREAEVRAVVTRFSFLLNAMERAAQENNPAEHGYAAKRKAVLDFVAALAAEGERPAAVREVAVEAAIVEMERAILRQNWEAMTEEHRRIYLRDARESSRAAYRAALAAEGEPARCDALAFDQYPCGLAIGHEGDHRCWMPVAIVPHLPSRATEGERP